MKTILSTVINVITKKEIYGTVITIAVAYFIYHTLAIVLEQSISRGKTTYDKKKLKTITRLFTNIAKYIITFIALATILSIYGVNVTGMITGLGITATILGLALQDTFKDIINGINIILENYFIVGDNVTYNNFTGEVIEFGLKSTKIRNVKGEVLIVANRNIMELKNLSLKEQSVQIEIPLPYEEDITKIEKIINKQILPKIDKLENVNVDSTLYLGINDLADSAIKYLIQFKCKRDKQWQSKRDAYKIIMQELTKNNVTVPYSQMEVHLNEKQLPTK